MRIAIMGAGAVGGYFGALLAKSGNDVTLIARGEHLKALQKNGLNIKSYKGDFTLRIPTKFDPKNVGEVDLTILTVKSYDTLEAIDLISPLIGQKTLLLSLQNGIDNEEKIAKRYNINNLISGVAYIGVRILHPGTIYHSSRGDLIIGDLSGVVSNRMIEIKNIFNDAGIPTKITKNITELKWKKLIWNATFNPISTVTGLTLKEIMEFNGTKLLAELTMQEIIKVAKGHGIKIEESIINDSFKLTYSLGDIKTSMLQDFEAGKRLEIDAFNGIIIQRGNEIGCHTPINKALYCILSLMQEKIHGPNTKTS